MTLRRGKPLNPGKGLMRYTPLRSNGRLNRAVFVPKGQPPVVTLRKKTARPGLPKPLRDQIWKRDGGLCVICGNQLPRKGWHCHHRKLKSQGGRDDVENLIGLHDPCHEKAHHERSWARQRGYIVHPNTDPATRPVLRHGTSWALPGEGEWIGCEPPSDYIEEAA